MSSILAKEIFSRRNPKPRVQAGMEVIMKKTDRIKNAGKVKNTDKRFQKNALSLGLCAALGLSVLCGCSGAGNLFISSILHRTCIAVDERGTRAGAVTSVEISDECASLFEHEVYLNRPFVYMIIDCEENISVFIGATMSVK